MYSIKEINYFGQFSRDLNLSGLKEKKETLFPPFSGQRGQQNRLPNVQRSAKGHVATINMPAIDCT